MRPGTRTWCDRASAGSAGRPRHEAYATPGNLSGRRIDWSLVRDAVRTPVVMTGAAGAAVAVLVAGLLFGGGVDGRVLPGIPEPGAVTEWALPVVTMLANLLGVLTVGLVVTAAFLLPGDGRSVAAHGWLLLRRATWLAVGWAVLAVGLVLLTVSDLLGTPVDRLSREAVLSFALS